MNVRAAGFPVSEGLSMGNDSSNTMVQLGNAAVVVRLGADTSHVKLHTASLCVAAGRRPVHLRLEGPDGSVTVELSRIAFWRLTAEFHEQSIAADDGCPKPDARRTRRGRS
jgi:hypothetical protein